MTQRALAAVCAVACVGACRPAPAPVQRARDAAASVREGGAAASARDAGAGAGDAGDAREGVAYGPANPWGDGSIPVSTATGPEADATRATLIAVRASVGFYRIARRARDACPTLEDLARAPAASAFDRATMGRDAWGTAPEIECQGRRVRVRSHGPDRVRDTPDDIVTP